MENIKGGGSILQNSNSPKTNKSLLEEALGLWSFGFKVFPARVFWESGKLVKKPLVEWKRLIGELQDEQNVLAMPWNGANAVGAVMGEFFPSFKVEEPKFYVCRIDIDNGFQEKAKVLFETVLPKETLTFKSPRGGEGYIYLSNKPAATYRQKLKDVLGIELLGVGSITILPPSFNGQYKWLEAYPPAIVEDLEEKIFELAKSLGWKEEETGKAYAPQTISIDSSGVWSIPCLKFFKDHPFPENLRELTLGKNFCILLHSLGLTDEEIIGVAKQLAERQPMFTYKDIVGWLPWTKAQPRTLNCAEIRNYMQEEYPDFSCENCKLKQLLELEELEETLATSEDDHPIITFNPDEGVRLGLPISRGGRKEIHFLSSKGYFRRNLGEFTTNKPCRIAFLCQNVGNIAFSGKYDAAWLKSSKKLLKNGKILNKPILEVFQNLTRKMREYLWFEDTRLYTVVGLWIMGTYIYICFKVYPYLAFVGVRGSGKSTALDFLSLTCRLGYIPVTPTKAFLGRVAEAFRPTILIDEASFLSKTENDAIIGLLETAFEKGRNMAVTSEKGEVLASFETFTPVAYASRTKTPFEAKSILIPMEKTSNIHYSMRKPFMAQDLELEEIVEDCIGFAIEHGKEVYVAYLQVQPTSKLYGREFDLWRPLLALAKVVLGDNAMDALHDYAVELSAYKLPDKLEAELDTMLETLLTLISDTTVDKWKKRQPLDDGESELQVHLTELRDALSTKIGKLVHHNQVEAWIRNLHILVRQCKRKGESKTLVLDVEKILKKCEERGLLDVKSN